MMLDSTTTMGVALLPPTSHRERDDNFTGLVYQANNWRVIICKDSIQWIIQSKPRKTTRSDAWKAVSYFVTRKALMRVWRGATGDSNGSIALGKLPERIGGGHD
tara:strand:- start:363 stop:674 length:312 start_codon:yes stop_codon:yes gene_type:complete